MLNTAAAPAVHQPPQAYGYELPKDIEYMYNHVRKTHNSGVFDAYTDEMKRARKSGILTGEG
jgi:formate C-acetyltransferase